MAVQDLWHSSKGARTRCPDCRSLQGPPTARHGTGKRWRVIVPGHPSRAFTVKADAAQWERELWQQPGGGPSGKRVADLIALWLDGKRHVTPTAFRQYRDAATRADTRFGHLYAADITRADIQAWVSSLTVTVARTERPASHTLRSKALQAITGALRIAQEARLIDRNPADGVRVPKAARRPARFLDPTELVALADASIWPAAIWLLGTGGYRISEALNLTVGDVDPRRRRVHVRRSKSGRERDVPIMPKVIDMLDLERPKSEPLLIHPLGHKVRADSFRAEVVLPAAAKAGIVGLTTHDLRHTAASLAIRSGADVKMVQDMLGHASAAMTLDLYGHLFPSGLDAVADRLGGLFAGE